MQFWPNVKMDIGELKKVQRRMSRISNSVGQLPNKEGLADVGFFRWKGEG